MKQSKRKAPKKAAPDYVENSEADAIEAVIAAYSNAGKEAGRAALPAEQNKDAIVEESESEDEDEDIAIVVKTPLGLSFDGTAVYGCFVTKVKDGGNAAGTGEIDVGMRIVAANGKDCEGLEKKDIVTIVKKQAGTCDLILRVDIVGYQRFRHKLPVPNGGWPKIEKKQKKKKATPSDSKPKTLKKFEPKKTAELDAYGRPMKPGHDKFGRPLPKKELDALAANGAKGGSPNVASAAEDASLHAEMLAKAAGGRKNRVKSGMASNTVMEPVPPVPRQGLHGMPPGWRMAQDAQGRVRCQLGPSPLYTRTCTAV